MLKRSKEVNELRNEISNLRIVMIIIVLLSFFFSMVGVIGSRERINKLEEWQEKDIAQFDWVESRLDILEQEPVEEELSFDLKLMELCFIGLGECVNELEQCLE